MISCSQIPMNFPDRCVGQAFPWHYQFEWLISGSYKGLLKIFFHLYSLYRWVVKVAVEVTHMEHLCRKRKYPNFYWFVDGRNCWNHWEICFGGDVCLSHREGMGRCVRHVGKDHSALQGVGNSSLCLPSQKGKSHTWAAPCPERQLVLLLHKRRSNKHSPLPQFSSCLCTAGRSRERGGQIEGETAPLAKSQ